jgi:twinkle protein
LNYDEKIKRIVKPKYSVVDGLSDKARAWFAGRGITGEVLARNKITDGPEHMPQLGETVNAIRFPYCKDGEIVNIKFRDGNKNFKMVKEAEKTLYKYDDIIAGEPLFWTEGEIDALSLEVAGFKSCVSVPNGASDKLEFLSDSTKWKDASCHVLALDNDEAGEKLKETLLRLLPADLCKVLTWPEGIKDANACLMKYGVEGLRVAVDTAKWPPMEGVSTVDDFADEVVDIFHNGLPPGASTGWYSLDENYTVKLGELTILCGIPSHGKSTFLDALLVNLATGEDWKFALFSPETRPPARHVRNFVGLHSGKSVRLGLPDRLPDSELIPEMQWVRDHFFFITPSEDKMDIMSLLNYAEKLVARHGLNGFVFDPWGACDHVVDHGMTEHQYTGRMLGKIVRFATKHNIHIWVVAHPTKLRKERPGAKQPVPQPFDISGSSFWYNSADCIICVWRDMDDLYSPEVHVHVQKIKCQPEVGKHGMVKLDFEYKTGRYLDQ